MKTLILLAALLLATTNANATALGLNDGDYSINVIRWLGTITIGDGVVDAIDIAGSPGGQFVSHFDCKPCRTDMKFHQVSINDPTTFEMFSNDEGQAYLHLNADRTAYWIDINIGDTWDIVSWRATPIGAVTAVPEPVSWLLTFFGGAVLWVNKRMRGVK